jgi:putative ABC transport system substrate-binding protein
VTRRPADRDLSNDATMNPRRTFLLAAAGIAFPWHAHAQATPSLRRIAFLSPFPRADVDAVVKALRPALERLGWHEGRTITLLEPRTSEGQYDRLPALAVEVVALRPDVILVQSAPATRALVAATTTIPIVMVGVGDPVAYGIVRSLAEPGGNVTGAAYLADESARKALGLLKEIAPRIRSVAVFTRPDNEGDPYLRRMLAGAAKTLGLDVRFVDVRSASDFAPAFATIARLRADALLLGPEALLRSQRFAIGKFAFEQRLPFAIIGGKRYLDAQPLLTYGPAFDQYPSLAASYVDRIFRGANPAKLPVEQPTKFELGLNEAVASTLGLTIPQSIRIQATE